MIVLSSGAAPRTRTGTYSPGLGVTLRPPLPVRLKISVRPSIEAAVPDTFGKPVWNAIARAAGVVAAIGAAPPGGGGGGGPGPAGACSGKTLASAASGTTFGLGAGGSTGWPAPP